MYKAAEHVSSHPQNAAVGFRNAPAIGNAAANRATKRRMMRENAVQY